MSPLVTNEGASGTRSMTESEKQCLHTLLSLVLPGSFL